MAKQVSPLRQRMIDDMMIRNMSPNTQKGYNARETGISRATVARIAKAKELSPCTARSQDDDHPL